MSSLFAAPEGTGGDYGHNADDSGSERAVLQPLLDEDFLEDLRALEDLEVGGGAQMGDDPNAHYIEEDDVYKMRELISEKPRDVIQYIEEEGVIKLGEFEIQDSLVFKAFGQDAILTMGDEHLDCDWESFWREVLSERGKLTGIGWSTTMTMEAHAVNIRDAAAEGSRGLLQPLLKRYQARGCPVSVFGLPAVQAVIHFKWTTWARRFLVYELLLYLAWLTSFVAFSLLFEAEDAEASLGALLATPMGLATVVCDAVAVAAMVPFLYMELCTIWVYQVGWINFWNILDITCYGLQVAIAYIHVQRQHVDESWFSILVAVQHILLWSKVHYFARVFNPTKNLFVDTIRIVISDMKWFLTFLVLTMMGFSFAFYSLFRQDRERFPDFCSLWHSFASMFSFLLAMFDYNVLYGSTNPTAAMVLFIIYEFVMNIMLLNIMIAIMTSSFNKVTQDEGLRLLCSKTQIIDELESTLPRWVKSNTWYPPFVHILKVHPASTYEINLNSVWSGIGLMENNLLNANQELRLRLDNTEDKINRISRKMDIMARLMLNAAAAANASAQHHQHQLNAQSSLHCGDWLSRTERSLHRHRSERSNNAGEAAVGGSAAAERATHTSPHQGSQDLSWAPQVESYAPNAAGPLVSGPSSLPIPRTINRATGAALAAALRKERTSVIAAAARSSDAEAHSPPAQRSATLPGIPHSVAASVSGYDQPGGAPSPATGDAAPAGGPQPAAGSLHLRSRPGAPPWAARPTFAPARPQSA